MVISHIQIGVNMKKLLLLAISFSAIANVPNHLPLDLSFEESQKAYKSFLRDKSNKSLMSDNFPTFNPVSSTFSSYESDMELAIKGGEKVSRWLKLINSQSSQSNNPVRLTSRGIQRGIPVDRPSKYSPKIVSQRLNIAREKMPKELFDVIYGDKEVSSELTVPKEQFVQAARFASGLYQTATRWNMMQPYMGGLIQRSARDIRGYLELKKLSDPVETFRNLDVYAPAEQEKLINALIGVCHNVLRDKKRCIDVINQPSNRRFLYQAVEKYMPIAEQVYNSYFQISNPRMDVEWIAAGPNVMKVVFKDIEDPEIAAWLKENVEDEFKLEDEQFSLELNYIPGNQETAFLEFKAGVTPHVKGGNKIVMDGNSDIKEYAVQWTIRHEFGHILRLPDCYTEFYDTKENVMVNYQIDTTDLMCSRAGVMNNRIYEELKKHYKK